MQSQIFTAREFNQATSDAKKAAKRGPVFITDRGTPSHVLLSISEYQRLVGQSLSLADALHDEASAAIDFDLPRARPVFYEPDLG